MGLLEKEDKRLSVKAWRLPTIELNSINFSDIICKIFHIKEPISKGLAFGASSHAIGTARAIEIGEVEGAMSGLAVAVSGIFTVVLASVCANFL